MNIERNETISFDKYFPPYCSENCNFPSVSENKINFIQISSGQSSSKQIDSVEKTTVLGIIYLGIMVFTGIIIWWRFRQIYKSLKNTSSTSGNFSDKRNNSLENSHSIPCRKCKFFNNNIYIKCAVNPNKVLRPEAKDCTDYSPQSQK
ncbi:MAG: hypothetical protein AB4368_25235 [Xenococcaceae cyanobacterium]